MDSTPRRFVHDESGRVIGEYGTTGTVFAEHVWLMPDTDEGGWETLALLGQSTISTVHGDHLGVPVVTSNCLGASINDSANAGANMAPVAVQSRFAALAKARNELGRSSGRRIEHS